MTRPLRQLLLGLLGGVVGLVGGYFLSVFAGLALFPDSNLAPLPFLCTLWPVVTLGCIALAMYLGVRWEHAGDEQPNGRCPMCGYDLRGDLARGCSECGWNREP